MAAYWDIKWDDEEWLKNQSAATLRYIYTVAEKNGKDTNKVQISAVLSGKLEDVEKQQTYAQQTTADTLAYVQHMDAQEEDMRASGSADGLTRIQNIYRTYRDKFTIAVKAKLDKYANARIDDAEYLDTSTLNQVDFMMLADAASRLSASIEAPIRAKINAIKASLGSRLASFRENNWGVRDRLVENVIHADNLGVLDEMGVVSYDKEAFYDYVAEYAGLTPNTTPANDRALHSLFDSTEVRDEAGALKDLYSDCLPLASAVQYEFPDSTSDEDKTKFSTMYNDQLMANAAQRAAQAILQDRSFLARYKTEEEIKAAYKQKVTEQFERGVVLAGLAGNEATAVMMNEISIDKDGNVQYTGDVDGIADAIEGIKNGTVKINPMAVQLDKYMLDQETDELAKEMKRKKIKPEGLTFWQGTIKVVSAAYDNIVKQGGWKKMAANFAIFGSAAAAMASGTGAVVLTGAAVYAGWTAVNAWIMPAHDLAKKEGISFGKAFKRKTAEPDFKNRAWLRTAEGLVVGGVTAGMSGVGGWLKTLARQGTMAAGKGFSLFRSKGKLKSAQEELKEAYSLGNFNRVQTAEGYVKQDRVALKAVVIGALIGDAAKGFAENQEVITSALSKLQSNADTSDAVSTDTLETDSAMQEHAKLAEAVRAVKEGRPSAAQNSLQNDTTFVAPQDTTNLDSVSTHESVAVQDTTIVAPQDTASVEQADTVATEQPEVSQGEEATAQGDEGAAQGDEAAADATANNGLLHPENIEDKDLLRMYKDSSSKWGEDKMGEFGAAFDNGQVDSCPEGMSPVEFVDRLTRLRQLAPFQHREAIKVMIKDLTCDDYVPSDAEKDLVQKALGTIIYEKGRMNVVIPDADGNLCVKGVSKFGQYVGEQQMAKLDNGTVLPLRNCNVTTSLSAEVDCDKGTAHISSVYKVSTIPGCKCDCTPHVALGNINAESPELEGVSADKIAKEINFANPKAEVHTTYDGKGEDYAVDYEKLSGQWKNRMGAVWADKGSVTAIDENGNPLVDSANREVHIDTPRDITGVIAKMGNNPTRIVNNEDGSTAYVYETAQGKPWSVVVEENGTAHVYQGQEEVIIDEKSAQAMAAKMSEGDGDHTFTATDSAEQNLPKGVRTTKIFDAEQKGWSDGTRDAFIQTDYTEVADRVAPAQAAVANAIKDGADVQFLGEQDGKLLFNVEGVGKFTTPHFTHVNMENATAVAESHDGAHTVNITAGGDKIRVEIDQNNHSTTFVNDEKVVLDKVTGHRTEALANQALADNHITAQVSVHDRIATRLLNVWNRAKEAVATAVKGGNSGR